MDEMTNVLVSTDLLFVVWNWSVLWLIFINPLSPDLVISSNSIWELLEEEGVVIVELVLGESLEIQPGLLLHPVEGLGSIINTCTSFKEETHISRGQLSVLDEDFGGHH